MPKRNIYEDLQREWRDLLEAHSSRNAFPPDRSVLQSLSRSSRPIVLFAELEDARASYGEVIERVGATENADRPVTRLWTLKDFIAHLASWAKEFRREVELAINQDPFDYMIPFALSETGPNEWNQAEVEKRRGDSLESLLQEFDAETQTLQEIVLALPVESIRVEMDFPLAPTGDAGSLWRGDIGELVQMKCLHDRWHIDRLNKWHEASGLGKRKI